MNYNVHIVIADNGWILEKCASEIARRSGNVTYGIHGRSDADIQYYVNYSARRRRQCPVELAFFTHRETDEGASRRYFEAINAVDHCVFMSRRYADEVTHLSDAQKSIITPGVALESFVPKVRVGVVGRTYHTGRKGEGLVAQMMDIEGIEWRFTGSGWPLPSRVISDGSMPEFYNDLDYVLVPALYEGGPMAVLEGLACGIPIIASDVGWVNEYPHIPFENGNAASLRSVLQRLVAERQALRTSVTHRTWDEWSDQHFALFDRLAKEHGLSSRVVANGGGAKKEGTSLLTHGGESATLGGPSVRVPRTAEELVKQGWKVNLATETHNNFDDQPLAHIFNVWPADSCFNAIERAKAVGKLTVLSPIFLNLSQHVQTRQVMQQLFGEGKASAVIDRRLAALAHELMAEENLPLLEPFEGYHDKVRLCVNSADAIICLSDYERRCLEYIGAKPKKAHLVRNPVDVERFVDGDPSLFRNRFELDDYILCVGRIEHRKNQLVLAHAAKTMGKTVVFIGHSGEPAYAKMVRDAAGEFGRFVSRIDPSDPMLRSAFAGASVFCLPSWAEGAPLAALEAAAAGVPLVLSDRAGEREYFGDLADYVHPADIDGLRSALESASRLEDRVGQGERVRSLLRENNSWEKYGTETIAAYRSVLDDHQDDPPPDTDVEGKIYLDLTSSFHSSGHPTGIARVESRALEAMSELYRDRLVPIVWNSNTRTYVKIDLLTALVGGNIEMINEMEASGKSARLIDEHSGSGGHLVMLGGAWIRNTEFIWSVRQLKRHLGCSLTLLVHDLIQMKLKHLYPVGYGDEFERNATYMCDAADSFLIYSDKTLGDLREFLLSNGHFYKRIAKFRLGDLTSLHIADELAEKYESDLTRAYAGKKFVIFVSSIEVRKNHILLMNVWRRLAKERGANTPSLLFIGRPFAGGNDVIDALKREPSLAKYIHHLHDVSDSDLDWFYRHCLFTVFPSLYEGWGLPVAESLSFGRVCVAASGTSIDEIAPGLTDLIDPYDFKAWRDRIAFYFDNPAAIESREAEIRGGYKPANWLDAAESVTAAASTTKPVVQRLPIIMPGENVSFAKESDSDLLDQICADGWGNVERTGRWSLGDVSRITFRYSSRLPAVMLRLNARALTPSEEVVRTFLVQIGDEEEIKVDIPAQMAQVDVALVGRTPTNGQVLTEAYLRIRPEELISPASIGVGNDNRLLGVFVSSIELVECDEKTEAEAITVSTPVPVALAIQTKPAVPAFAPVVPGDVLAMAEALVTLPPRFTGRGLVARVMRLTGLDRLYLYRQKKLHRREFESIRLIIRYLRKS